MIMREAFKSGLQVDIRSDEAHLTGRAFRFGRHDGFRPDLCDGHGNSRSAVYHGMFAEQDDLTGSGSRKCWHRLKLNARRLRPGSNRR